MFFLDGGKDDDKDEHRLTNSVQWPVTDFAKGSLWRHNSAMCSKEVMSVGTAAARRTDAFIAPSIGRDAFDGQV